MVAEVTPTMTNMGNKRVLTAGSSLLARQLSTNLVSQHSSVRKGNGHRLTLSLNSRGGMCEEDGEGCDREAQVARKRIAKQSAPLKPSVEARTPRSLGAYSFVP
eukprot:2984458-Amphidinium_carterae.1